MKVNCNINNVIDFLIKQRDKGYTSVELIDDARNAGWVCKNPQLNFLFSKQNPNVLGIDARVITKE